ncbi:barstar family protein [Catenulispora rubra]|uniref:barstar family protein n=1 Tax=Catenulispora rubra TaxID=280293 RepID=UPI00189258A9|nr:barstar family protein [Catenulispora rubra]
MTTRYALMREDASGQERLLGHCVDVAGLFADPPVLPLEALTLGGCKLTEAFHASVGRAMADGTSLGELLIAVWDAGRPLDWWTLSDVTVTARVVDPADRELPQLRARARVGEPTRGRAEPFEATRFVVHHDGETVGTCQSVAGLYDGRLEPSPRPLDLLGCTMTEELAAVLADPDEDEWFALVALDRTGRPMARRSLLLRVADVQPSELGAGLVDIALFDGVYDPPPLAAGQVWDDWYEGVPDVLGTWARYGPAGRLEWLMLALGNHVGREPDVSGRTYHVGHEAVTDVRALHCALGEALRGPGRYYGWGLDALDDCLGAGFGVHPPFTVVWQDSAKIRQALADSRDDNEDDAVDGVAHFEQLVRILERNGVTVVGVTHDNSPDTSLADDCS